MDGKKKSETMDVESIKNFISENFTIDFMAFARARLSAKGTVDLDKRHVFDIEWDSALCNACGEVFNVEGYPDDASISKAIIEHTINHLNGEKR